MLKKIADKWRDSGTRGVIASGLRKIASSIESNAAGSPALQRQRSAHGVLSRYMSFQNKEILEVGGSQGCDSAHPFLEEGASRVVVTGLDHITAENADTSRRLHIVRADALQLSSLFRPSSFDVAYGISIIEHIPSPKLFLEEVRNVLRPGGIAYFEGNPIWSSPKGHHLWIATWGGKYKGTTSANYLFSDWPGEKSSNPLPDWSHLLMTQEEMTEYLFNRQIPKDDVGCITDWVYHNNEVNRLTMTEIAEAYTRSGLTVLEANTSRRDVPHDIRMALHKAYSDPIDYGICGVSYVLVKL